MSRKIKVFIAASLDGYIATADDSLSWLTSVQGEGDNGYGAFMKQVDTVVMGRRTYEWLLREVGRDQFPYRGLACYVLSSGQPHEDGLVTFTGESAEHLAARLLAAEGGDVWLVGGGKLLHDFNAARLVDEWIVTVAPIILGGGIPLFRDTGVTTRLTLTDVTRYGQFAQLHYLVQHDSTDTAAAQKS